MLQRKQTITRPELPPNHAQSDRRRGVLAGTAARTAIIEMGLDPVVRMNDVEALTGLGASMIYQMMSDATFPKSIPLTPNGRARGWRLSAITEWLAARESQGANRGPIIPGPVKLPRP